MKTKAPSALDTTACIDPAVTRDMACTPAGWQHGPKRFFDVALAVPLLLVALPVMMALAVLVRITSKGPALYWSKRVGRENRIFLMPKFRSMRIDTPQLATHLIGDAAKYLTPVGSFLRRSSLDELPQLLSILAGHLSFVGPRPALFNQMDLVAMRTGLGIHKLTPGLTGWAQVNGRDDLSIPAKVKYDLEYLQGCSLLFDFRILRMTFVKVLRREGVAH